MASLQMLVITNLIILGIGARLFGLITGKPWTPPPQFTAPSATSVEHLAPTCTIPADYVPWPVPSPTPTAVSPFDPAVLSYDWLRFGQFSAVVSLFCLLIAVALAYFALLALLEASSVACSLRSFAVAVVTSVDEGVQCDLGCLAPPSATEIDRLATVVTTQEQVITDLKKENSRLQTLLTVAEVKMERAISPAQDPDSCAVVETRVGTLTCAAGPGSLESADAEVGSSATDDNSANSTRFGPSEPGDLLETPGVADNDEPEMRSKKPKRRQPRKKHRENVKARKAAARLAEQQQEEKMEEDGAGEEEEVEEAAL